MIRAACALCVVALACLVAMLLDTRGTTAIAFTFVGHGCLALALALFAYARWGPVELRADERRLHQLAFRDLSARDFLQLAMIGSWRDCAAGERLVRKGESVDEIHVVLSGCVRFEVDGQIRDELGPGRLVGSTFLVTEEPAWGDAVVSEPTRILSWRSDALQHVLENKPDVRAALQEIVSEDLARKVRTLSKPGG